MVSQQQAAKWAIKNLPEEWHRIIVRASAGEDAEQRPGIALSRIKQFVAFADAQLHATPGGSDRRIRPLSSHDW